MRKLLSILVVIIVLLTPFIFTPQPVEAADAEITLSEISQKAVAIVIGTVTGVKSQWNTQHTRISTNVTLSTREMVKGSFQKSFNLTVEGGKVDGITEWVSDAPTFTFGEQTVVFLTQSAARGLYTVYGQTLGKYDVVDGKVGDLTLDEFKEQITDRANKSVPNTSVDWVPMAPVQVDISLPSHPAFDRGTETKTGGWTTIISEDFESGFPSGWTVAGSPTWGESNYTAYAGSYSGWVAGSSGASPTSGYSNNMNAWMVFGPFSLSGASAAELSFYHWIKTEPSNDYIGIFMSVNGTNFYGYGASGQYPSWNYSGILDLSTWPTLGNLAGSPSVYCAFKFGSNSSITDTGVFIDNVLLRKYVGSIPVISEITPSEVSAGTDSQITLTGAGFGTTPGSVNFLYRTDKPSIIGDVVSWSDTSIVTTVPTGLIDGYPASASSGPVYVLTSDGTNSGYYPFTVSFSYGGRKWSGLSPVVDFKVNPNTTDCSGEEVAVQNAAATWTAVTWKDFAFSYSGTTLATSAGLDSVNSVMWKDLGGPGPLAHAISWIYDDGSLAEIDIEFNDYYNWSTDAVPLSGRYDIQTVALHELGHWLNLRDLYGGVQGFPQDSAKVMFGIGLPGQLKRTLDSDDIEGIRWIYPGKIPAVSTRSASNVTATTADLNASIDYIGKNTSVMVSFEWGEDILYGNHTEPYSMSSNGNYTCTLNNLLPSHTYHFRIKVVGNATVYGKDASFFTIRKDAINGRIAYVALFEGNNEIWTMNSDGTHQVKITDYPGSNRQPDWSPDGTKIVFLHGANICIVNSDGTGFVQLTTDGVIGYPDWSPDGTKIVYSRGDIWTMNQDGSDQHPINDQGVSGWAPSWSPDGTKICYVSIANGPAHLFVMDSDGSNQRAIFSEPVATYSKLAWSPDSTRIAFTTQEPNESIIIIKPDGSEITRITSAPSGQNFPTWSPDGSKIAYGSYQSGFGIYIMDSDGSDQIPVVSGQEPSWAVAAPMGPIVTTDSATEITYSSARINGKLTSMGTADSVIVTFQWGTQPGIYTNESEPLILFDEGEFACELKDLSGNTRYYFRVKATGIKTNFSAGNAFSTPSPYPSFNGKIAFVQPYQIYLTDMDGSNVVKLTNSTDAEENPCFSPDGTKIAFSSRFGEKIIVTDLNGTEILRIPNGKYPSWSSDGNFIAFVRHDPYPGLWITDSNGTNQIKVWSNMAEISNVHWSPDGTSIAFRDSGDNLSICEFATHERHVLVRDIIDMDWSSDGSKLIILKADGIFLVNSDGSYLTQISTHSGFNIVWSPDNTKIAFTSGFHGGYTQVYIMDYDGKNVLKITTGNNKTELDWAIKQVPPMVNTINPLNITSNSACLVGELPFKGCFDSVQVSFEWGETEEYNNETTPETMTEDGEFSFQLTGLTANTSYHYRAKAVGTTIVYGDDVTFNTKEQRLLTINIQGNGATDPEAGDTLCTVGSEVILTATPMEGWAFLHWSGAIETTENPVLIIMGTENIIIVAHFAPTNATLIGRIKTDPTPYLGQTVKVAGEYRGWEIGHGVPPLTRSDWVIQDATAYIYVTGNSKGLRYPNDIGRNIEIVGIVRIKDGLPYIELSRSR